MWENSVRKKWTVPASGDIAMERNMPSQSTIFFAFRCTGCLPGYHGEYCENIDCIHGILNSRGTECICEKPFFGPFCNELTTTRIYSYYNNKVINCSSQVSVSDVHVRPNGSSSIDSNVLYILVVWKDGQEERGVILLSLLLLNFQVKRISNQLGGQNIVTTDGTLKYLLKNHV